MLHSIKLYITFLFLLAGILGYVGYSMYTSDNPVSVQVSNTVKSMLSDINKDFKESYID